MSPLTGLGFYLNAEAINMKPRRGFMNVLITAYCIIAYCQLPTTYSPETA
jgi:hypothetical protein